MMAFAPSVTAGIRLEAAAVSPSPFLLLRVLELGVERKIFSIIEVGEVLTSHACSSIPISFPGLTSNEGVLDDSLAGSGT